METQIAETSWNIFDRINFKDESTTQWEFVEYKERNVQVSQLNELNMISQDLDVPLLICDSFLRIPCSIVAAAANVAPAIALGGNFTTGKIAFNNNGFNIFQRAQYYMNDQLIEDLEEVGLATLVKGLIDYSRAYSGSLGDELWNLDTNYAGTNYGGLTVFAQDGTPLTALTAAANNTFQLRKVTAGQGAALANGQSLTFFLNGQPISFFLYTTPGTLEYLPVLPITGGNIDANNTLILFATTAAPLVSISARYDTVKMYLLDGTEVNFFVNSLQATLTAPAAARYDIDTIAVGTATAPAALTPITARTPRGDSYNTNTGFEQRVTRTLAADGVTASKQLCLLLPIRKMFRLFEYNQHVFRGVKHQIKLYKNIRNKTLFMRTPDTYVDGNLIINDISWWVPALRPSIEYGLKLDKELNSGQKTRLNWNQLKCIYSPEMPLQTGVGTNASWRITSAGNKPVKVYIVFRYNAQYNSALPQTSNNPMVLQNMGITNINLRINSLQFPKDEFLADFVTNDDYVRLYMQYIELTGKAFDEYGGGYCVTYADFKNLYPIFCFDLTKQDPQIWANVTQAELELKYTRAATQVDTSVFTIYAMVEFEKTIELQGADNRLRVIM